MQLLVEFGAFQRFTQRLAETALVPAQLSLGYRVQMLKPALLIDHQQSVINTVEHRLKPLLACQQFVDIGCLMLAQSLGHDSEAPGQQVHFSGRRKRQHHLKVALADVVSRFGQCLDRCTKAPGNAMGGNKADDQHRKPDQAQQGGDDQGPVTGRCLCGINSV